MMASPHEPTPLSSLRDFGRALATSPNDVLVGFLQPVSHEQRIVTLESRRFPGAILYALTRSNGFIQRITFELTGSTFGQGGATLRDDGDWQIPPLTLGAGTTSIVVIAHAADGLSAQAQMIVVAPESS